MKTGNFFHYKTNSGDHNSLTPGRAYTFGEDSTGTVWVGTLGGLNRYNPLTDTFSHYFEDVAVFRFYPDSSGGIWLGTSDGLWYISSGSLDQQDPIIYRNNPDDPNSLSSNIVSAIHEDEKGAVWVGTAGGGLDRLDLTTGQFTHFTHNPDDPNSLSDNSVYSIIQDSSGRLWFGTQNGLNLFDESSGRFFQYHTYPDDPNSLKDDVIDRVFQDKAGVIWVATMAGICKLNEIASHFTFYQEGSNRITGKIPDQSDLKTESVQSWSPGLSDSLITSIYEDNNNTLWVGTSQGGLNRLNRATGQITVFQHDLADLPASVKVK